MNTNSSVQVVDAFADITNVASRDDIDKQVSDAFARLNGFLSAHCGPYAQYAIINENFKDGRPPVFTNDGLKILSKIEYGNALDELVRRMLVYVAGRVEGVAGDGTTTAIKLFAGTLEYLKKHQHEYERITSVEFMELYHKFLETFNSLYRHHVITTDSLVAQGTYKDRSEAIGAMAYMQALTSAHGDVDLAEAAKIIFTAIPEEGWSNMFFTANVKESDTRVQVMYDDYQFTISGMPMWKDMLNTEEFSKFDATVDLIVFTGDFVRDSATFSYLEQNIFPRYETDPAGNCSVDGELRHLLLVVPIGVDVGTKEYFNTKMRIAGGYQHHRISIFMHEVTDPKYNDLVALTVVAQEEVWMHGGAIPWIKHDVEALWDKGELKFNGLYDPKDSQGYHPDMSITNSNVRTMVNSIDSIINDHKADSTGANHTDTINRLTQLKGKLSLTTRAHIQIGGAAYDNVTLRDIVEDVVKAVRSTLVHGCVYGGGITLLETLLSVKAYYSDVAEDRVMSSYLQYLCDAFIYGTTGLINAVHNHDVIESAEGVHDFVREYSGQSYNVVKRTSSEFGNGQPIIQAAEVDPEILKRFGEVAIRFVNMSKIITPGAVFLGDKKKKYLEAEKGEAEKGA